VKPLSPFRLAVIIGFGTVFAISLLMIVLPPGTPMVLYDVGRWMRGDFRGDPLFIILPLLSLVGYVEAGLMYAFFTNREIAKARKGLDLVDEVGEDDNPTASYPQKGAMAGALIGLFASLVSFVVYVVMFAIQLDGAVSGTSIVVGAGIAGLISLGIAVILGAIFGAVGGIIGSRLKPQTA
jgi:small-conductance mechanosensitive channel